MKFFALIAASFAGLAAAQTQCMSAAEAIPSCGQSCLASVASSYGCAVTDFACQCSHSKDILSNSAVTPCVVSSCQSNYQTALAVASSASALCACVASNGGGASTAVKATSTAAIPSSTAADAANAGANTGAASAATAASTASPVAPMFTGGAAYAAGSVGGIMAGVIGVIAAL